MAKRRSPVWNYFTTKSTEDKDAICNICQTKVPRGGQSIKSFSTTNLVNHLRRHPEEYRQYTETNKTVQDQSKKKESFASKQITLEESKDRTKVWEISDPRAVRISHRIGEMIALDCQPLSIVNDEGFVHLVNSLEPRYNIPSRKFITEKILPDIYSSVKLKVDELLSQAKWVSCTTDIWTAEVNNESFISLTIHWISTSFERKSTMLNVSPIPGSHTGDAIREKLEDISMKWKIEKSQLHCFVADNAANVKKAMIDGGYSYLPCFAHTLQLVIHDGLLAQRYVQDIVSKCRRIVGHFKHSQLASTRLKEIQGTLNMPQQRMVQDVATRWNSTLYMMQSVMSQKMSLAVYTTENDSIPQLSSHQFDIIEKVITILKPFEDITQAISSEASSASVIIPFVSALRKSFEDQTNHRGVQSMKKEILTSLNRRFGEIESNELLLLSTALDPCWKVKLFTNQEEARELLIAKVRAMDEESNTTIHQSSLEEPPPEKRPKTAVLQCLEEILTEASTDTTLSNSVAVVDQYLSEPTINYSSGNAYAWWANNKSRFPILAKLAQRYLSTPPTSVPSERLFSTAGIIYEERRNRLSPENAELLLFIKNNYSLL